MATHAEKLHLFYKDESSVTLRLADPSSSSSSPAADDDNNKVEARGVEVSSCFGSARA
jgi:hypothetical protein